MLEPALLFLALQSCKVNVDASKHGVGYKIHPWFFQQKKRQSAVCINSNAGTFMPKPCFICMYSSEICVFSQNDISTANFI